MPPPAGGSSSSSRQPSAIVTETLVRGTIKVQDLTRVVFLIRSLCPEVGHLGEFRDHNRVYSPAPEVRGVPKNSIKLRRILKSGPVETRPGNLEFLLLTHGIADRRVSQPVERRQLTSVGMGEGAMDILNELGCTMQYEYVRSGLRFRTRAGFAVEVYVIKKFTQQGNADSVIYLHKEDHAIVDVVSHDPIEPEELLAFMNYLEPIVVLRQGR